MYALFTDISWWEWLTLSVMFAAVVYQGVYYGLMEAPNPTFPRKGNENGMIDGKAFQPPVTVVVPAD